MNVFSKILVINLLLSPLILVSQLSGTYSNWIYSFGITLKFQEDGTFQYWADRSYGEGEYIIEEDTLSLNFREIVDSMIIDCSTIKIDQLQSKYSVDSIRITITVFDCHSDKKMPFPIVSLYNGNPLEEITSNDTSRNGEIDFVISITDLPIKVLINGFEYLALEVSIPDSQNTDLGIVAKLHLEPITRNISGSEIWRFIIFQEKRKFIKLKDLDQLTEEVKLFVRTKEKWSFKKLNKKMMKYFRK